jgi:hypothetical protein
VSEITERMRPVRSSIRVGFGGTTGIVR